MKAINKTDLCIGQTDIEISLFQAIDKETSFNMVSNCHKAKVVFKRFCADCNKELSFSDIQKAVKIGNEYKVIDTNKLQREKGNLKILGTISISDDDIIFGDSYYFVLPSSDKKNKEKSERTIEKFSYLREALKHSKKGIIGIISSRGKEHLYLLKPYFYGLIAINLIFAEQIRDIREAENYIVTAEYKTDAKIVKDMAESLKVKKDIELKDIKNSRNELIEKALSEEEHNEKKEEIAKNKREIIQEIVNF